MPINITGVHKAVNPAFLPRLRDYNTRVNVEYGGAGSGKSHFVVQKMILKALQSQRRILVVRKVAATIRESIFALFLSLLSNVQPVVRTVNKTDMTITLINGSQLIFKGLDDREKIKSITGIDDIVIEEATELTEEDFTQLSLRLRSSKPQNQIHLMFNPVSKANWVYSYFFLQKQPGTVVTQSTYRDNRHLPESYVKTLEHLQHTNPAYYRIYVLGEFATLDKLVFPIIHKRIISADETRGLPFWCGLDFGYVNDPSALTWGRYDEPNGRIYTTGEYHKKEMTNSAIIKTVIDLGLSKEIIIADSAEPKSIDELRRAGLRVRPAKKGPDSVISGIDFILQHELILDERCINTIEEYENYTWVKDKKTDEYINRPVDVYNHHIDGTRYGLEEYRFKGGSFVTVKL